jgi:hypothetical protein
MTDEESKIFPTDAGSPPSPNPLPQAGQGFASGEATAEVLDAQMSAGRDIMRRRSAVLRELAK